MIDAIGDESELNHLREEKDARGYIACFHLDRYYSEVLGEAAPNFLGTSEYKAGQAFQLPQTMAEALRLAADQND